MWPTITLTARTLALTRPMGAANVLGLALIPRAFYRNKMEIVHVVVPLPLVSELLPGNRFLACGR